MGSPSTDKYCPTLISDLRHRRSIKATVYSSGSQGVVRNRLRVYPY